MAGLCATLFNMGHMHAQNDEIGDAVSTWLTVYRIARQINLHQALEALADLAPQIGLAPGLDGWEELLTKASQEELVIGCHFHAPASIRE